MHSVSKQGTNCCVLYGVSSQSMMVLNTQQVYSTVPFLAVLVGGDCSIELEGLRGVLFAGVVCLLQDFSSAHCS